MRLLFLLLAATAAAAQSPSDFRSRAELTPAAGASLQRFTLPFEAYRDTRPDLADIRIFNSADEMMPMAYASTPDPSRDAPVAKPLPMFPIYGQREKADVANLDVVVNANREGAIVSVHTNTRPAPAQKPVAWLLDASTVKTPMRYLTVEWNAGPGVELARVSVEASDDLKSWSPVASRSPVMVVQQHRLELAQRKIDLRGASAKYLRITAEPATFELRGAQVEPEAVIRPASRMIREVAGTAGAKPGEFVYDLGARLPVESVRLKFGAQNSAAPFDILARNDPTKDGRLITSATFYRLLREGVEMESPAVEIGRQPARYWIARLDPQSPPPGGGAPTLEVRWRPAQVVFVARGDGPFTVAFGNPEVKPAVLSVAQLIPGYERQAELKLPQAELGAVKSGAISGDWLRAITGGASPRKLALWAVLVVAVIALAWMAWLLSRQMKQPPPEKR